MYMKRTLIWTAVTILLASIGGCGGAQPPETTAAPAASTNTPMSKEQVKATVAEHIGEIQACYDAALATKPALKGAIDIKVLVLGTGKVQMVALRSSTLNEPTVEQCATDAMSKWIFPASGGTTIFTHSFAFAPGAEPVAGPAAPAGSTDPAVQTE